MLNEARLTYSNTEVNLVSLRSHTPSFHISPSKKHKPPLPPMFSPNELGKLARASARELARHGWPRFFKLQQRYTSTSSSLRSLPHPFAPMLHRYATQGVPAPSTAPPWSLKQKDRAVLRGPHPSAAYVYDTFLKQEMVDMARMGYWVVLPYSSLRRLPQLRIAPCGVVPQRDRRPRTIIDYTYNGVNQTSLDVAPIHAMQFGSTLQRVLQRLAYCNPAFGPPLMAKIDLADGYYRIPLSAQASLTLAVVLPNDGLGEPILGLPLSLPMGWSNSPPYFCSFTETCADLANTHKHDIFNHPFNYAITGPAASQPTFSATAIFPMNLSPPPEPLSHTDVYIDDFLVLAQQPTQDSTLRNVLQHLHGMFEDDAHSPRRPIVSVSKVEKGDTAFSTRKRLLGWDVDSAALTIQLPAHRQERLSSLLQQFICKRHTTRRQWQKLLGELRSMTLAMHSSQHLFSALQHQLHSKGHRFRISQLSKLALADWQIMAQQLRTHPVAITSLVPHAPHYVGATDASVQGMGGFWLPTIRTHDTQPCAWRSPFPETIQSLLVSHKNKIGKVNNSDLELAAAITGHATQHLHTNAPAYTNTYLATDNSAAQAWITKGSVSTDKPPASLLRLLAQHCRLWNARLSSVFVNGETNNIADLLSRSFHLSDVQLLRKLQSLFPTKQPWRLVIPPTPLVSQVNCAILNKQPGSAYRLLESPATTPPGHPGHSSAIPSTKTLGSCPLTTRCPFYKSMLPDIEWERLLPPDLRSKLAQWKQPFVPWGRRSPHWAIGTPGCKTLGRLTSGYTGSYRPITKLTLPHTESNQSLSKSSNKRFASATYPMSHTSTLSDTC
jgi:hypothetical protein